MQPRPIAALISACLLGCVAPSPGDAGAAIGDAGGPVGDAGVSARDAGPRFPLALVRDASLPGSATRFDYQELDLDAGRLVLAHMGENEVLIVDSVSGVTLKQLAGINTPRGVAIAPGEFYFSSAQPNQVVAIDSQTLNEVWRVTTGNSPDGLAWDGAHRVLGVSAQGDGALTLVAGGGRGPTQQVPLGIETGNVAFDSVRSVFWVAVVNATPPDSIVAVEPSTGQVLQRRSLPGCDGAHGLRLAPSGGSAFVACENNATLMRVELDGGALSAAPTGQWPDVLALDTALGLLYVAAESGDVVVFDVSGTALTEVDREHIDDTAHSVAVDPVSHLVFFPLARATGPVLHIMRPRVP